MPFRKLPMSGSCIAERQDHEGSLDEDQDTGDDEDENMSDGKGDGHSESSDEAEE